MTEKTTSKFEERPWRIIERNNDFVAQFDNLSNFGKTTFTEKELIEHVGKAKKNGLDTRLHEKVFDELRKQKETHGIKVIPMKKRPTIKP